MPGFDVEVHIRVVAETSDDAHDQIAALLDPTGASFEVGAIGQWDEVEFEDEDEMTPEEFLRETGLAPDEDADRAYTDFLDHNDQNLSFADWWAEHQGDYV